jgi:hypothetical protein
LEQITLASRLILDDRGYGRLIHRFGEKVQPLTNVFVAFKALDVKLRKIIKIISIDVSMLRNDRLSANRLKITRKVLALVFLRYFGRGGIRAKLVEKIFS